MNIRVTARALLLNQNNQMLLLKVKNKGESYWLLPGGKIEEGELALQTAKRELYEETGIKQAEFVTPHSWYYEAVIQVDRLGLLLFKEHIFLAYTQETNSKRMLFDDESIEEMRWWDVQEFIKKQESFPYKGLLASLERIVYFKDKPQGTLIIER